MILDCAVELGTKTQVYATLVGELTPIILQVLGLQELVYTIHSWGGLGDA